MQRMSYEGPLFFPSSPLPLLLSQSSYFCPLGMVGSEYCSNEKTR